MLTKAYVESVISETRAYEWYNLFQDDLEDFEDDERPGRSSTSTTECFGFETRGSKTCFKIAEF